MLWILFAIIIWGLVHSLMASNGAKALAQKWLGARLARFYRLFFNLFAGITLLPILGLVILIPDKAIYAPGLPWSALMVLGEILAIIGLAVGLFQTNAWEFLGVQQLWHAEGSSHLTTSGLYRYIRHPLYSAGLLFIWLLPRMTVNLLVVNLGLTAYILIGAYFEEKKLRQEFGQEYADYAAVTPMLIPFTKWKKTT